MNSSHRQTVEGAAWYSESQARFLGTPHEAVVAELSSAASSQGWHVEAQQHEEWGASVGILQGEMRGHRDEELQILRDALHQAGVDTFSSVILEFDFRRRGLRIDCVLLGPGIFAVLEFKRSKLTPADADQVTNYCINLVEFHEETRRLCEQGSVVVPILVQTQGSFTGQNDADFSFHASPWRSVLREPMRCDGNHLGVTLGRALGLRRGWAETPMHDWLSSRFSPSSTILDAAISLFGDHDVSAIEEHAGSVEEIEAAIEDVARNIREAQGLGRNRIVLVSGAPGAGKTLVGLRLAFDRRFREDAVFVTGNAPLVDVLTEALKRSYKRRTAKSQTSISGYPREQARLLIQNSTFKLVKAHHFLGERGDGTSSADGRVVIFDEAQRTYEEGRQVLGKRLEDHEADLILQSLENSYAGGAVVVALLGHNQAIGRGERGAVAWLEAAERRGWQFAVADETLALAEFSDVERWGGNELRVEMSAGHLRQSLRFYRNSELENWVHSLMEGDVAGAAAVGTRLAEEGHQVWLTRDLQAARSWVRRQRIGEERAGIIASGQGRRLAAEGLYVDQKPSIAHWMLEPSGDIRSSNMLESVQNQFQVQGLELDYTIVCWDADLRRESGEWRAWKISGSRWQRDKALVAAKNSYRVLLTRARKGMIIFVPRGDWTGEDDTRSRVFYDDISSYLVECGAQQINET